MVSPVPVPWQSWAKRQPPSMQSKGLELWLYYFLGILASIPILQFLAIPHIPLLHQVLAYVILILCTRPAMAHFANHETTLPVFPIICLVYGGSYAMPVFFLPPQVISMSIPGNLYHLKPEDVTTSLVLTLIGVTTMQIG